MKSLTNQICHNCSINVAIIDSLSNSPEFLQACTDVPVKLGIVLPQNGAAWPFRNNMSWYAYMMYCLLVVPREIYDGIPVSDSFYRELLTENIFREFHVVENRERHSFIDDPKYYFGSLRNSVSHVNYEWNDEIDGFEFFDHPPRRPEPENWHWHVRVSGIHFHQFLARMADATLKVYNEINSGIRDATGAPLGA